MNPVLNDIPPEAAKLAPYQPGRPVADVMRERGVSNVVKLASNENPLGCSPAALKALNAPEAEMLSRYPDSAAGALRAELAQALGVGAKNILAGNGSNDILELAAQLTLAPGRAAVYSRHAFIVYKLATLARRARPIVVPTRYDFAQDLPAIAAAAQDDDARIVFIANPNNPTGAYDEPEATREMMTRIPKRVLVVLDEAYFEYAGEDAPGESIRMLREFPNLLVARTFSKIHGLAGLRVGYGVGDAEVIDALNRLRQPFNLNAAAQRAALAALADSDFAAQSRGDEPKGNGANGIRLGRARVAPFCLRAETSSPFRFPTRRSALTNFWTPASSFASWRSMRCRTGFAPPSEARRKTFARWTRLKRRWGNDAPHRSRGAGVDWRFIRAGDEAARRARLRRLALGGNAGAGEATRRDRRRPRGGRWASATSSSSPFRCKRRGASSLGFRALSPRKRLRWTAAA